MNPTPTITALRATRKQLFELKTIRREVSEAIQNSAPTALAQCLYYKALSINYSSHDDHLMSQYLLGKYHQQILNFDKAIELYIFFLKNKGANTHKKLIFVVHQLLAQCYAEKKLLSKAIQQYRFALKYEPKKIDEYLLNREIGQLLYAVNDDQKAIHHLKIALQIIMKIDGRKAKIYHIAALHFEIAAVFIHQLKIEEATAYIIQAKLLASRYKNFEEEIHADYQLAKLYFTQKKYQNAYRILHEISAKAADKLVNKKLVLLMLVLHAETCQSMKLHEECISLFEKSTALSKEFDIETQINTLDKYFMYLDKNKKFEAAYQQLKILQDLNNEQDQKDKTKELNKARIIYENREEELKLENLTTINQLNEQLRLKTEELEQKNITLQKLLKELMEGQLLRSQMNPHFIYNSLNSISSLIKSEENKRAIKYLLKFSRLTRSIFQNSTKEKVLLSSEISILKNYLEMELLRFKNRFNYTLMVDEKIDTKKVKIPPMILQPVVENAIKHGIFHLPEQSKGQVDIRLTKGDHPGTHKRIIQIEVVDNGVGIPKHAKILDNKERDSALTITKKRLQYFNKTETAVKNIFYQRKKPRGTKFTIYLIDQNTEN
jgi:sensor histidine kinase YesM